MLNECKTHAATDHLSLAAVVAESIVRSRGERLFADTVSTLESLGSPLTLVQRLGLLTFMDECFSGLAQETLSLSWHVHHRAEAMAAVIPSLLDWEKDRAADAQALFFPESLNADLMERVEEVAESN